MKQFYKNKEREEELDKRKLVVKDLIKSTLDVDINYNSRNSVLSDSIIIPNGNDYRKVKIQYTEKGEHINRTLFTQDIYTRNNLVNKIKSKDITNFQIDKQELAEIVANAMNGTFSFREESPLFTEQERFLIPLLQLAGIEKNKEIYGFFGELASKKSFDGTPLYATHSFSNVLREYNDQGIFPSSKLN
ncbi:MAG: hypothetical protein U9Q99_00700 [Nanoarchaeota archaeon]|nr:hypothetical protein [Nanoarchaeota archaeon]